MDLSKSRPELNPEFVKIISAIIQDSGLTKYSFCKSKNIDPKRLNELLNDEVMSKVYVGNYLTFLYSIGVSVVFNCKIPGEQEIHHFTYKGIGHEVGNWGFELFKRSVTNQGMGFTKGATSFGVRTKYIRRFEPSVRIESLSNVVSSFKEFSKTGSEFTVTLSYDSCDVSDLLHKEACKAVDDKDSFLSFVSKRTIFEMACGRVKTSMGEVIKPFL